MMNEYKEIIEKIDTVLKEKKNAVIAIDGRCTSGKTYLSEYLHHRYNGNLIHMDDFFLQVSQRTEERLNEPGGNVDYERFLEEVLIPLKEGERFSYRPYHFHGTPGFKEPVEIDPSQMTIIEGSYSMRKEFLPSCDLKIVLDVDSEIQIERLKKRDLSKAEDFQNRWIPMEEKYLEYYRVKDTADICFDTSYMF